MTIDSWTLAFVGVGSFGTLVLAIAALCQGRRIREQLDLGDRQATTAEGQAKSAMDSANVASQVHREAMRSRVDQDAPGVVVFLERPEPPRIDAQRHGMPNGNEMRLLAPESFERSRLASGSEFVFEQDRNAFLWFYGRGLLVNEGRTSARVRLSGEGRFVEGRSPLAGDECIKIPVTEGEGLHELAILRPGGFALFEWAGGHTVGDWASARESLSARMPEGSIWFWVVVFDPREMGVIDTQMMHFIPEVVQPVPGREAHWKVANSPDFGPINQLPRRRNYRHEGASTEDVSHMRDFHGLHPSG